MCYYTKKTSFLPSPLHKFALFTHSTQTCILQHIGSVLLIIGLLLLSTPFILFYIDIISYVFKNVKFIFIILAKG